MINFVALDVETSNPDPASICQFGMACVHDGRIEEIWSTLIDPQDLFHPVNTRIHGVTELAVRGAPLFAEVFPAISARLGGSTIVSHSLFDRGALRKACARHGLALELIERPWLDSARIARRAWPGRCINGAGLRTIANDLGIEFDHHNASEDARAAAEIVLRACRETGRNLEAWLGELAPVSRKPDLRRDGNADGPLYGEVVCFTGALCVPRREAADRVAATGCTVESGVTRATTILVVGDQDIRRIDPSGKSSKHRKAEALIESGQEIRIIGEADFFELIAS